MIFEHVEENGDRRGLIWQLSGDGEKAYTKICREMRMDTLVLLDVFYGMIL